MTFGSRFCSVQPCMGIVFTTRGSCIGVFDVPCDATVGRLTVRTFLVVLPGAEVAAGVTTVGFQVSATSHGLLVGSPGAPLRPRRRTVIRLVKVYAMGTRR